MFNPLCCISPRWGCLAAGIFQVVRVIILVLTVTEGIKLWWNQGSEKGTADGRVDTVEEGPHGPSELIDGDWPEDTPWEDKAYFYLCRGFLVLTLVIRMILYCFMAFLLAFGSLKESAPYIKIWLIIDSVIFILDFLAGYFPKYLICLGAGFIYTVEADDSEAWINVKFYFFVFLRLYLWSVVYAFYVELKGEGLCGRLTYCPVEKFC